MEMFKHMFTGKDNETYDLGRILWAIGCIVFLGLTIFAIYRNPASWDMMLFASGFGVMLGSGAGSLALKAKTEPDVKP